MLGKSHKRIVFATQNLQTEHMSLQDELSVSNRGCKLDESAPEQGETMVVGDVATVQDSVVDEVRNESCRENDQLKE